MAEAGKFDYLLIESTGISEPLPVAGLLIDQNEGAGLVHRSPAIDIDEPRLLLTLDFVA